MDFFTLFQLVCPEFRSSHPKVFLGKGVLKIYGEFTGEHPCRSAISIKLPRIFIEIAFWHGCSLVNLLHIFRTPFSQKQLWRADFGNCSFVSLVVKESCSKKWKSRQIFVQDCWWYWTTWEARTEGDTTFKLFKINSDISKHLQKERNILSEHSMLNIPDELKNIEMIHVYKKTNIHKKLNYNLVRVLLIWSRLS